MENRDIFEELKKLIRCVYISDMRFSPWQELAREAIARMDLKEYTLFSLNDVAEYLYGENVSFIDQETAKEYFRKKIK